ncbi:MAG: radical SAM protein, partial [Gemmatimonadota bacterium]
RPDLVGVTAFTSQAPRAYEVAAWFRARGVPVVMGGIHASMRQEEASTRVDAVVTGEAEGVWAQGLHDAARGTLQPLYVGGHEEMEKMPLPRHDLLPTGYQCGVIQTTRGCPLNCSFCSVSSFNGRTYRRRPVEDVIEEFRLIKEKYVLLVDDNLIGTRWDHIERAKRLFRAMIEADLGKKWICQATINMADDEELLTLAGRAGCVGVFIGFESTTPEGLIEIHKKYNLQKARDYRACVRRIQRHNIVVVGSFIIGLDVDRRGIGLNIAATADRYGVDLLNVLFLTPLPGTDLWKAMEAEGRITADQFPEDWAYYTLTLPVGRYRRLSRSEIIEEMDVCNRRFYSLQGIARRVGRNLWKRRNVILTLIASLSYRNNGRLSRNLWHELNWIENGVLPARRLPPTGQNQHAQAGP